MEPIHALERLNEIAFSFYTAGAFAAASNLKLFDCLADGPHEASTVANMLNVHPEPCRRLLVAMQQLGLVEQEKGKFENSELGSYLQHDAEVPMSFSQHDNYFYRLWEYLPDAIREFSPRHEQAWGKTAQELYKAIYSNEDQLRQFFKLLDSYNIPIGSEAAKLLNFEKSHCILDVAGGTGSFAAEIVKVNKHLRGISLDLPPIQKLCEEMIVRSGLSGRFEFHMGDMFKFATYPKNVDVVFLSYILHNWNDENCRQILENCRDALPKGGMLVISEKVLQADGSGEWWGVMMSLQMLLAFQPGSKERTLDEYRALLGSTGFGTPELLRLKAPRDLLVAFKR